MARPEAWASPAYLHSLQLMGARQNLSGRGTRRALLATVNRDWANRFQTPHRIICNFREWQHRCSFNCTRSRAALSRHRAQPKLIGEPL